MDPATIAEIIQLGIGLLQGHLSGKAQDAAEVADTLTQIFQKSAQQLQSHTGQPIDVSLIKPEAPIQ